MALSLSLSPWAISRRELFAFFVSWFSRLLHPRLLCPLSGNQAGASPLCRTSTRSIVLYVLVVAYAMQLSRLSLPPALSPCPQVGFSRLANRMTMARTMKLYKLPDNTNSASE